MKFGISIQGPAVKDHGYFAKLAEDAGFDLALTNDNRGPNDVFVKLAAMALATSKIKISPGICRAFVRTPIATASAMMTLDHLSDGRAVLSLGGGTRRQIDFGIEVEHGGTRLKEVIEICRLLWANHPKLFQYDGKFYQLKGEQAGIMMGNDGGGQRQIPILVAAIREPMLRITGEVADGTAGHPNWHIPYIQKHVMPALEAGWKKSGRTREDFDLTCYRICHVVTDEVDEKTARRRAAKEIAGYMQVRSYSLLLDSAGWFKEKEAIYDAALVRKDYEATLDAVTDEMIDAIALVGTPSEIRKKAEMYDGILDRIVLHGGGDDNKRAFIKAFAQ